MNKLSNATSCRFQTSREERKANRFLFAVCQFLLASFWLSTTACSNEPAATLEKPKENKKTTIVTAIEALKTKNSGKKEAVQKDEIGKLWVRLAKDAKGEAIAMQTAIVRYVPKDAETTKFGEEKEYVDLVGAIHVGDLAYYKNLNKRFEAYDALLYELVAPKGTIVEKGRGTSNAHPIGALQNGMKGVLGLKHQLSQIDYTKANFVHADMSPEEMSKTMNQRGESFMKMYFRMIGAGIAQQSQNKKKGKSTEMDMLKALFSNDRDRQLKIALAGQFEDMESMMGGFNGKGGSTLITERNKVAMKVLAEELKKGKKKIGIFYGAGHLSDMHKTMLNEFHMKPVHIEWLDAWDLRKKK